MLKIRGIDHIVIRTANPATMVAFYRDVLGCPVERVAAPEIGLTQLRAGNALIDIVSVEGRLGRLGGREPGREGRNLDHFCVSLVEFDEAAIRRHLSVHGISIGDTERRYGAEGYGPSLYIEDPDGNTVELKGPSSFEGDKER